MPKWLRKQLPAATWLQERLGSLWGSILEHFEGHFRIQNRSENGTQNNQIFVWLLGPQEIRATGSGTLIVTPFGPGGNLLGGR